MTAHRPDVVAFDVVETLFSLAPVEEALRPVGVPLPLFFTRLLRDGFALAAAGGHKPFREVAASALRGLAPRTGTSSRGFQRPRVSRRACSKKPVAERLLAHLRDHYGIDAVAATKASQHNDRVFHVDRRDGDPWITRVYPPARPRAGVQGDATILRFLERQDFPAERLAADDAVSELDGTSVFVTRFVPGGPLPDSSKKKIRMMGDLLGRLHALAPDGPPGSRHPEPAE